MQESARDGLLHHVASDWPNCTLYFEYVNPYHDFRIEFPIVLRNLNEYHVFWGDKAGFVLNLHYINCILVLVSLQGVDFDESEKLSYFYPPEGVYKGIYPRFVIFLAPEGNFKRDSRRTFLRRLFYRQHVQDLPAVFVLLFDPSWSFVEGHFLCWYCSVSTEDFISFLCGADQGSCFGPMVKTYRMATGQGHDVKWGLETIKGVGLTVIPPFVKSDAPRFNPNVHIQNVSIVQNGFMPLFLFEPLNSTILEFNTSSMFFQIRHFPLVHLNHLRLWPERYNIYPTGYSAAYRFITSDGVYSVETSTKLYVIPIQPLVALLSLLAAIILSFFTILDDPSSSVFRLTAKVVHHLLIISSAFVEQPGITESVQIENGKVAKVFSRMVILWLIACTVITSCYKGNIGANYVVKTGWKTKWSRLEDIANFSLYFGFENETCPTVFEGFTMESVCYTVLHKYQEFLTSPCIIFQQLDHYEYYGLILREYTGDYVQYTLNQSAEKLLVRAVAALDNMRRNTKFFCLNELDNIIDVNLGKPRTAFVTTKGTNRRLKYWNNFEAAMARNPAVKFAHNGDQQDNFFGRPTGIYISAGLNPAVGGKVENRMKVLLTSGVYNEWMRIAKFQLETREQKIRRRSRNDIHSPLSFRHAGVQKIFMLLMVLLGICIVVQAILVVLMRLWIHPVSVD